MALIGSASVEIRAVDRFFERDVRAAVKKVKNVGIELKADVDLTKVNKKLADLRYRLRNNIVMMNIQAPVDNVRDSLQQVVDDYDGRSVTISANANVLRANALLATTARARDAQINAKVNARIDPQVQRALQGLFYTITGSIPIDKVRAGLLGLAANFEMIAIKSAVVTSAISALAASLFSLSGSALTIGRDLADVVGLAAVAPAGFFMLGTAITASTLAWKGFSDALSDDPKKAAEALAKLPKEAQAAAQSLKGVGKEIRTTTQTAFWKEMGGEIESLHEKLIPQLKSGLEGTGTVLGNLTSAFIGSMRELGENNTFVRMFENSNQGLANMERGIGPLVTAFGKLGDVGSRFLPRFGDWISDISEKFGNWIDQTSEATIATWIEDAVTTVKLLGSSVKSTADIFGGLADAATRAGFGGLKAFSEGLSNAADVVNQEPFKSHMVTIFKAAGDATGILGDAIGKLLKTLGSASDVIGGFFREGSGFVGAFLDNITSMLENSGFLAGLYTMISEAKTAMKAMEPGFIDLGDIIGNLGIIAGEVFTAMAPGFNSIMDTLDGVVANLTPGLTDVIPVFNAFVQSVLAVASGPIQALAAGVGAFATAFANIPGWLQTAAISLGAIALLQPKLSSMFGGMASGLATARQRMDGDLDGLSKSTQNMWRHFGDSSGHLSSFKNALGTIPFAAATSGMRGLGDVAGAATQSIGRAAGSGLRGALSGGAAMLGGPWGIALAAGIGIVSAFGQAQEESKARVEAFSGTLDKQTAHVTNATKSLMASTALDGVTDGWDDFFRGVLQGSKSTEEALSTLGISTKQYTDKLSDPSGRDAYVKGMDAISDAMRDGRPITDEMAKAIGTTKEQLQGVNGNTMRHLADKAGNAADELTKAEEKTRKLAEATGLTDARAAVLAKNFETLASATSSASDKFGALKSNLDMLNGNMMSTTETRKQFAQSLADSKKGLEELTKGGEVSLNNLYKVGDGFDFASQSGRDFHTQLGTATDAILKNGTAALDQAIKGGKSSADANSAAIQAMQPGVAALRENLKNLGVDGPKIDDIIRSFGLMPDQIATAISVEGTEEAQRKIIMTKLAADSFSNGNYKAVLAALPDSAKKAIADATGTAKEFADGNFEAVLKALDETGPGKEQVLASILGVTNGNYEAPLKALDLTNPQVKSALAQATGYANGSYTSTLEARDHTGAVVADAKALSEAFAKGDYTAALKAMNNTAGPINAATGEAQNFSRADFTAALKAADATSGGRGEAARQIGQTVGANYTAIIKAMADQGTINTVNGALNGLTLTRWATIKVQYQEAGRNPGLAAMQDGLGGYDGAILNSVKSRSSLTTGSFPMKAFADGGIEKHVAQIAPKKNSTMRFWAEPETGGEAYIPLAKTKRTRSLKILEEVARLFGFGLYKQGKAFADGGIEKSTTTTQTVTAPVSAGPNVEFNVWPSAALNEEQIARYAMNELFWNLTNN